MLVIAAALLATACGGGGGQAQSQAQSQGAQGGITVVDEVDTQERYGIGVPQGNDSLRGAINAALATIIDDGTYAKIYTTWFPGSDVQQQLETIGGQTEAGSLSDPGSYGLHTPGRMVVGSDIAFEPFEFVKDGQNKGFDIDLMRAIAERLGVEVEFVNTDFGTLFPQLASGQFDAIISAITITNERDQSIDFSNPYFLTIQGLAVLEGAEINGVDDLDGARVAVQTATTGEDYALEHFMSSDVRSFPSSDAAFAALVADQVDAVFIDLPVARNAAARQGNES